MEVGFEFWPDYCG